MPRALPASTVKLYERLEHRRKARRRLPEEPLDVMLEALGEYAEPAWSFITGLRGLDWLANRGDPGPEVEGVRYVRTWETAIRHGRSVWTAQAVDYPWFVARYFAEKHGLKPIMDIAHWLWLDHGTFDYPTRINWAIGPDARGMLREIVTREHHDLRFFERQWDWYRRGHWPCGVDRAGRLVVF